jgi:hypothetical protein
MATDKKKLDLNKIKELIEKGLDSDSKSKSSKKSSKKSPKSSSKSSSKTRSSSSSSSSSRSSSKERQPISSGSVSRDRYLDLEQGVEEDMTKVVFNPLDKGIELSIVKLNLEGKDYEFLLGRSGNLYMNNKDNELIGKLKIKDDGIADVYMCEGWRTKLI